MLLLYKLLSETPLQALNRLRFAQPGLEKEVLSYAGRLDPMAEGVMIVLVGKEENNNRKKYLGLDKEYEVEILFDIETDTHDILGKVIKNSHLKNKTNFKKQELLKILESFVGTFLQSIPYYSSKHIAYRRKGKILEQSKKEVTIYSVEFLNERKISAQELLKDITQKIELVKGDFRQKEIIELWKERLENKQESFFMPKIKVFCSSGTYMRSLAEEVGKKMETEALAYSIKRTKIENSDIL